MYRIINEKTIQKRIEGCDKQINYLIKLATTDENTSMINIAIAKNRQERDTLKNILSNSIPLIPEIEKGYNLGLDFDGKNNMGESETFNNYISQLKLDI